MLPALVTVPSLTRGSRAPGSAVSGADPPWGQDSAAGGQIAVATWQKSTARRLVSVLAVVAITNSMLCALNRPVTPPGGSDHGAERGDHVGLAGQARGALDDGTLLVEHEHGRGAADAQP